jgi:hypothetical protein
MTQPEREIEPLFLRSIELGHAGKSFVQKIDIVLSQLGYGTYIVDPSHFFDSILTWICLTVSILS